jgi:hypothetical protein
MAGFVVLGQLLGVTVLAHVTHFRFFIGTTFVWLGARDGSFRNASLTS